MIKMIAGVYGLPVKQPNGSVRVVGMGPNSGPFSVDHAREAELVSKKLAVYVGDAPVEQAPEEPELPEGVVGIPEYTIESTAAELREIGKLCGLTFKVGMSKKEMVAALDAHIDAHMVDGVEVDDEDAPTFDVAEAVK